MTSSNDHWPDLSQVVPASRTSVPARRTSIGPSPARRGHFGEAVRDARERSRLTQDQLGQHIGYSRTAVSRMESSADPRLTPRTLARICEVLNTTMADLLGENEEREEPVKRREFMQVTGGVMAYMAGMAVEPGQVGESDVAQIEHGIEHLRALDQRNGGDRLGYFAERLVDDAQRLLRGSYNSTMGERLYSVLGEACVLAGWLAQDAGDPHRSIQLYSEVMSAATMANNPLLSAHACANLSLITAMAGQSSRAVQCARAGQRAAAEGHGGPRLRALLLARETTGLAQLGDTARARDTMTRALRALDNPHGYDPPWTAFVTEAELSGILGDANSKLGRHDQALHQISQAAAMSGHPRNAASWQVVLAGAHAAAGDPGQAATIAVQALPTVTDLSSTRIHSRVQALSQSLGPFTRVAEVAEFRQQMIAAGLTP
jgi:DNA-binding Xre family transcriptional regulator